MLVHLSVNFQEENGTSVVMVWARGYTGVVYRRQDDKEVQVMSGMSVWSEAAGDDGVSGSQGGEKRRSEGARGESVAGLSTILFPR